MPTPQPAPADTGTPRQAPLQPPSVRRPPPANRPPIRGPIQGANRTSSPFAGLLTHPCGVWVHVKRFRSGGVWGQPLRQMTRRGVLGGAA